MIDFEKILIDAKNDLSAVKDSKGLFDIRVKYLGKKSVTTELLKQIGSVPPEERAEFGKRVNILKSQLETVLNDKNTEISTLETLQGHYCHLARTSRRCCRVKIFPCAGCSTT